MASLLITVYIAETGKKLDFVNFQEWRKVQSKACQYVTSVY